MKKSLAVNIIPAFPGTYEVLGYDNGVELGSPIIAWRIETYIETYADEEGEDEEFQEISSECIPLNATGGTDCRCIGVKNPDKTISVFESTTLMELDSLEELSVKWTHRYKGHIRLCSWHNERH